jgi:hypothetical protein
MRPKYGVFGVLVLDWEPFCVTLEPPERSNRRNISCIPTGQYVCHKYSSDKFPSTWEVQNVYDRKKILFHPGNLVYHTDGCVILAEYFGKLMGDLAVLNSGKTFKKFMRITETCSELFFIIREAY